MANFDEQIRWTSSTPAIYLTVSYSKYRSGADMVYSVGLSISEVSGSSRYFGYPIYAEIKVNGESSARFNPTLKNASPSQWTSPITYNTGNFTVANKTSGTTALSVRLYSGSGSSRNETYTFDMGVDPAYTSITSFNVSKINETSLRFSWGTEHIIDYLWYSTNDGANWTGYDVSDGTSGSFDVGGLSPNTTYNCKIRVRRRDSQLTTDSGRVSQTTYKQPTQSMASKIETSITMNWSCDTTANYIWYSIDNGSNWTAVGAVNATSGQYTINGLSPNTSYNIKTRVRRSATNTSYDTTALSITTYDYPKVVSVGINNLTIGEQQSVNIYNPLGRTISVYMKQNNASGTTLFSGSTNVKGENVSYQFTPVESTLYASIPNSQDGVCVYSVVYGSVSTRTTSDTYKYKVKGTELPTFENFEASYSANYTALTNDNTVIINGRSTIAFTITQDATAKNSASISEYSVAWGSGVPVRIQDISQSVNLPVGTGNVIKVIAYDSRGLNQTYEYQIESDKIINYNTPQITAKTQRENGIATTTYLTLDGNIYYDTFGPSGVHNKITGISYWISTSQTFPDTPTKVLSASELNEIVYTLSTNNSQTYKLEDFQIHANGSSGGFPIGTAYYIKVKVQDANGLLDYIETVATITNGKIAEDFFEDNNGNYHHALNGLADNDNTERIYGNARIDGLINQYINGGLNKNLNVITSATNFNNLTDTGTYGIKYDPSSYNGPCNKYGVLIVYSSSHTGTMFQIYIPDGDAAEMYKRGYSSDTWTAWSQMGGGSSSPLDAYPIGSIYISTNTTNPNTLFGGTWERLSGGFLYATNGSYSSSTGNGTNTSSNNGNTGSTTISSEQSGLRNHDHSGWTGGAGGHSHTSNGYWRTSNSSGNAVLSYDATGSSANSTNISWVGDHTHGVGVGGNGPWNAAEGHTHTLGNHNHSISYIGVIVWRRTA